MEKEKKIYSKDLGIDLASVRESDLFKWFLACLLFGKPIQQEVAKKTYFEFIKEGLDSPAAIIEAGWDRLVKVLGQGHYVRFDYSTATKLLEVCCELLERYGSVLDLIKGSASPEDLSRRLQEFKGVGPKTSDIFLRDIRPVYIMIKNRKI